MNPWTRQNLSISLEISKVAKIGQTNQKLGTPRMLVITVVFEEKSMMMLQDKKGPVPGCLQLLSFLKDFDDKNGWREMTHFLMLISFWVWQGLQQDSEAPAMKDIHGGVRKVDFPGG